MKRSGSFLFKEKSSLPLRQTGCGGGLAYAAELFVGQAGTDRLVDLGIFVSQHFLAALQDEVAALAGHDTAQQQHMFEAVHIIVQSQRVSQIYTDALVDLGGAGIALFHELLNDLQLFGGGRVTRPVQSRHGVPV